MSTREKEPESKPSGDGCELRASAGSVAVCDGCYKRPGKLTHQFAHGPCGLHGEIPRFVFRAYHCRWCLSAKNRRLKREGKPLCRCLEWRPDAEILSPNTEVCHGANNQKGNDNE